MKWHPLVFIIGLVFLMSVPAAGEYYQYTDHNGIIRYTDDLTAIPKDQLPDAKIFESVTSEYQPEEMTDTQVRPEDEAAAVENGEPIAPDVEAAAAPEDKEIAPENGEMTRQEESTTTINPEKRESRAKSDELNVEREKLLKEYNAIEAEKKALGDAPPKNAKSGEVADYVQKTKELNKKVKAYNQQSKAFDEEVKAFNTQVENK